MLMTPKTAMPLAAQSVASGSIAKLKRRMPYGPIFSRMPARMTEMGVGASTWASGNQVWKGNIGILMAKPMKSATKTILEKAKPRMGSAVENCPARPCAASSSRLKVCLADIEPSTRGAGRLR